MKKIIYGVLCALLAQQTYAASSKVLGEATGETVKKNKMNMQCSKSCGTFSSKLAATFPAVEECVLSMAKAERDGEKTYEKNINFCRSLITWVKPLWEKYGDMSHEEKVRCSTFVDHVGFAISANESKLKNGEKASKLVFKVARSKAFDRLKNPSDEENEKMDAMFSENEDLFKKPLDKK